MKIAILIPMLLIAWVSLANGASAVVTKFSAGVDEIRIPIDVNYESLKTKKRLNVQVPAILFLKPIVISDVRKAAKTEYEEINFLIEYMKANLSGTPEEIVSFWLPEERKEKLALFKDKEVFARNRQLVQEEPGLRIIGIIYQKSTISVMSQFTEVMALGMTMKKVGNRLYLTDHPSNDLELAVIEAALKNKR